MISGVFGLCGSGKSCFLAYCAERVLKGKAVSVGGYTISKKHSAVYSNFELTGCYRLVFSDLGSKDIRDALILLDEASLDADSRNFKNFSFQSKYFFSHHRHFQTSVLWCSQSYDDTDRRIRNLTDSFFHVRRLTGSFSEVVPIIPFCGVQRGQIVTEYQESLFFQHKLLYLPKYYKAFDSFCTRPLAKHQPELW